MVHKITAIVTASSVLLVAACASGPQPRMPEPNADELTVQNCRLAQQHEAQALDQESPEISVEFQPTAFDQRAPKQPELAQQYATSADSGSAGSRPQPSARCEVKWPTLSGT